MLNTEGTDQIAVSASNAETVAEFIRIAEEYRPRLLLTARRFAPSDADPEDIVQDALLRAYRNLARFRRDSRLETWLYKITQNSAREFWRRQKGRVNISIEQVWEQDDYSFAFDPPDPAKGPEDQYLFQEMQEVVAGEINKLSLRCRQALMLYIVDELPQRAVAKRLHVHVGTVKARIFDARRMLKRAIRSDAGDGRPLNRTRFATKAGRLQGCR